MRASNSNVSIRQSRSGEVLARSHREGETYPTPEQLLANLPVVLRALCDVLLTSEITALDAAYRLASIVDIVEGAIDPPGSPSIRH